MYSTILKFLHQDDNDKHQYNTVLETTILERLQEKKLLFQHNMNLLG